MSLVLRRAPRGDACLASCTVQQLPECFRDSPPVLTSICAAASPPQPRDHASTSPHLPALRPRRNPHLKAPPPTFIRQPHLVPAAAAAAAASNADAERIKKRGMSLWLHSAILHILRSFLKCIPSCFIRFCFFLSSPLPTLHHLDMLQR